MLMKKILHKNRKKIKTKLMMIKVKSLRFSAAKMIKLAKINIVNRMKSPNKFHLLKTVKTNPNNPKNLAIT